MDTELPRLVVIDDSQEFIDFLETGLDGCFRFNCLRYRPGLTLNTMLAEIEREQPDHLLLDLNLGGSDISHELLEQATARGAIPPDCKVWIISQGGHDKEEGVLGGFQSINANTQNRLLHKPISPQQVCAELLDESVYEPAAPLNEAFPLPFRVLSRKGRVAYANPLWTKPDYPNPDESLPWLESGGIPENRHYVGSFFSSGKAGFALHSFRLEQDDEPFLGQIVEQQDLNPSPADLPKTLDHIFETMRQAGFTRGRYYYLCPLARHRESDAYVTVAELTRLSYPPPPRPRIALSLPGQG